MASCFSYFRTLMGGKYYESTNSSSNTTNSPGNTEVVQLDISTAGMDVVVVKAGSRVCGTGAILATQPIVQDKAYFEVKVQSTGVWAVGLAAPTTDTNSMLGSAGDCWALQQTGNIMHRGRQVGGLTEPVDEGDIIGITYDHVELNFYCNGKNLNCPITGLKGTLYPALYVDDAAILDAKFYNFLYEPPSGYKQMMVEKTLL